MDAAASSEARPSVSDSSKRILAAGKAWHKVLNVALSASADDVKKSYRQLALLHHPDKPDGDADTFKKLKEAYEVAIKKCHKRLNMASPKVSSKRKAQTQAPQAKAKARTDSGTSRSVQKGNEDENGAGKKQEKPAKPKPWRLQPGANKARIRKAVDQWQTSDRWQDKTKPEAVQTTIAEALAEQLQNGTCIPVDVRDTATATSTLRVRNSVQITFSMLVAAPDEVAPKIEQVRESGKALVLISDEGTPMSTCGLVAAILLDVFGFEVNLIRRLEGGYVSWCHWLDANEAIAKALQPPPPQPSATESTSQRPSTKRSKPKPWDLPSGASAAKIHKAIELWEQSERWDEKTLPDQIPHVAPQQVATWIRTAACVVVDVRKCPDASHVGIHEAELISFSQMVLSPSDVTPRILKLKESGKRLVLYSDSCERMDESGLLGALLLDVFNFDKELVQRLEGGCISWGQWLESNADEARTLEPLAMRLRRKKAAIVSRPVVQSASIAEVATPCRETVGKPSQSEESCAPHDHPMEDNRESPAPVDAKGDSSSEECGQTNDCNDRCTPKESHCGTPRESQYPTDDNDSCGTGDSKGEVCDPMDASEEDPADDDKDSFEPDDANGDTGCEEHDQIGDPSSDADES